MKRTFISLVIFLFGVIALTHCGSESPKEVTQQISHQEAVEKGLLPAVIIKGQEPLALSILDQMETNGIPGAAIAVINDGKIDWIKGYGVTSIGGAAVDGDTLFRATQITQLVTAMGILHLAEQGKLDLDADINEKLVSWQVPENEFTEVEKVTLRRILNHTAGFPYSYFLYYHPGEEVPNLLQVFAGQEPATNGPISVTMVPGTQEQHSNGAYAILQLLVEEVTSKSFQQIMNEAVLGPLEMDHSMYVQRVPEGTENAAMGYNNDGTPQDTIHPELATAGLWTSARDLAKLLIEIQDSYAGKSNKVLSQEMTRQMLTPALDIMGLGPEVHGEGEQMYFSLEGHGSCYLCYVVCFPNLGKGAVVLTNASPGEVITSKVLRAIAAEYDWPAFGPREAEIVQLTNDQYEDVAGIYQIEGRDDKYELRFSDGSILLIRENEEAKQLLPLSPDSFIETEFGLQYDIDRDDSGAISGFGMGLNGRRILTFNRIE